MEARVLGALIEKEITTPDYYPLSLNALVAACNQLSNREPVMTLAEADVNRALDKLRERRLAVVITGGDSRVFKFAHKMREIFELNPAQIAALCVLLLRGPQTAGELRGRSGRMHEFADLADVQTALGSLATRDAPQPALVAVLPRQPGTKESRYTHLLCGEPPLLQGRASRPDEPSRGADIARGSSGGLALPSPTGRLAQLEADNADLKRQFADLRREFDDFRRKFE
ncbi:MAG: DUF480 domain-containing protein [Opitutus sp.]|nr:DUF480 domain-containing protein [Opitutus sp.]